MAPLLYPNPSSSAEVGRMNRDGQYLTWPYVGMVVGGLIGVSDHPYEAVAISSLPVATSVVCQYALLRCLDRTVGVVTSLTDTAPCGVKRHAYPPHPSLAPSSYGINFDRGITRVNGLLNDHPPRDEALCHYPPNPPASGHGRL